MRLIIALIAGLWAGSASAITLPLTSDATSIVAGQSITFNVVIPALLVPNPSVPYEIDPGYDKLYSGFAGGGAFFNSGDGQTQIGAAGPFGAGPVTFTYLTPGDYVASVNGSVDYHTVECFDATGECDALPNGGLAPGSLNFDAFENITVSVPEPSTWAMMLLGFAGLGFVAYRSRRKRGAFQIGFPSGRGADERPWHQDSAGRRVERDAGEPSARAAER